MEKKIITISREFGSGGRSIGRMVAEKLGIPFYDEELVDHIALESGFAPKYVEEHGEHSPSGSLFSYAFAPQGIPGATIRGSLPAEMDLAPRIWMLGPSPGSPDPETISIPAIRPCSASATDATGASLTSSISTTVTAPVRSCFLLVP